MAISRSKMNRQLRESGGIMNVARREQFGLGSSIKRAVRKVIPNEVSKIAVKAAPFVAPFNPALAGAMAGIGSFDQTGSLSDAFKRGALTYGGGQAARFIGGAGFQQNPFTQGGAFRGGLEGFKGGFTTPFGTDTGLGKFFDKTGAPVKEVQPLGVDEKAAEAISKNIAETGMELRELTMAGQPVPGADPGVYVSPLEYKQFAPTVSKEAVIKSQPKILDLIKEGNYTEAAVEAGRKALSSVFTTPITNAKGEVVGSKLDKTALFAAGSFGLTYLDAKKIADEVGEDIGTEEEYDEATKAAKKEEYAGYLTNFFGGKKDGGRIGFAEGTYGDFKEFMEKRGMAIEELNKNRLLEEFKEYMKRKDPTVEAAEGGRIGFAEGSDDMKIDPKNYFDPRNLNTEDLILLVRNNRGTPEIFRELMLRDVTGINSLMLDEIGGKKLDKPQEVFQVNEEELKDYRINQRSPIEGFLYDLRENNPDIYGEYKEPRQLMPMAAPSNYAQGGRIGFENGGTLNLTKGQMKHLRMVYNQKGANPDGLSFKDWVPLNFEMALGFKDGGRTGFENGGIDIIALKENVMKYPEMVNEITDIEPGVAEAGEPVSPESTIFIRFDKEKEEADMLQELLRELEADGGRIGLMSGSGSKKKYGKGIESAVKQIDPLQGGLDDLKMGGGIPMAFTRLEKSFLFKNLAKLGGADRSFTMPQLYRILSNPSKFPKDSAALKAFLKIKGFSKGGDVGSVNEIPVRTNEAGVKELDMRATGGFVPIGVKEKADDVPAMLSKNEFVLTADAVRGIGGGSVEKGSEKLYNVMKQAEKIGKA